MRIAIDLRPIMSGKITGVETYIHNLTGALLSIDSKNEYVFWLNSFMPVDLTRFYGAYPNVKIKHTRIPNKILNFCLSFLRWPKIDRLIGGQVDVLWVPDPRPAPVSPTCRKVTTFHDLSFEHFGYAFSFKSRLWHHVLRARKEAEEATRIIAVSQFTRQELIDVYDIPEDKVTVIYEAASENLQPSRVPKLFEIMRRKYKLPQNYVLLLSTIEPRKNIPGAIQAFAEWQDETNADVSLVIAGNTYPSIFEKVHLNPNQRRIVLTGFIAEEDKAAIYQNALCLLYPSFYEGFGLPILEAMQCGTPVITSDTTATAEIGAGAALLVNPNDVQAIKHALHEVYSDRNKAEQMSEAGLKQAKQFSWKKAAEQTLEVLMGKV